MRQLFPIQLIKFKVVFVYCANFERERNVFNASKSVQLTAGLIVSFVVVTAIILWLLRRKFNLAHDEIQMTFLDSLILTIGGGNLRMDNRFERWFFGPLVVGTFFLMAVLGSSLLNCFISVSDSKVKTFDDLSKTNATIMIDDSLLYFKDEIIGKLR